MSFCNQKWGQAARHSKANKEVKLGKGVGVGE